MPGKLDLYNLGERGVNRVDSPLHKSPGDWLVAQNCEVVRTQGHVGIAKRLGLSKLNTNALAGKVLTIHNIPFTDPNPSAGSGSFLYANGTWARSANGTTWVTGLGSPTDLTNGRLTLVDAHGLIASPGTGLFYFPVQTGSALQLRSWNGTTDALVASASESFNPTVVLYVSASEIYVGVADSDQGKVYLWNGSTFTEVGNVDGGGAFEVEGLGILSTVVYAVGGSTSTSGSNWKNILRWTGATWATEFTGTPDITWNAVVEFNSKLYVTGETVSGGSEATSEKVLQRDSAGVWTDKTPPSNAAGAYACPVSFSSKLIVARNTEFSFSGVEVWSYDGSSWTNELDVTSLHAAATEVKDLVAYNGNLYGSVVGGTGAVLKRTAGGTWSVANAAFVGATLGWY